MPVSAGVCCNRWNRGRPGASNRRDRSSPVHSSSRSSSRRTSYRNGSAARQSRNSWLGDAICADMCVRTRSRGRRSGALFCVAVGRGSAARDGLVSSIGYRALRSTTGSEEPRADKRGGRASGVGYWDVPRGASLFRSEAIRSSVWAMISSWVMAAPRASAARRSSPLSCWSSLAKPDF
jgi:hypothetical protein